MSERLPWFRMYTDFLTDPKMIALAFEDQRHFIGVLALKSDGALDDVADDDLLDRIVAQRLWIDRGVIRDVKKRLIDAGLIDEGWQPMAWEKRQRASDKDGTAAERQRRFRESRKRNALRNATVTRLDTDTDTDTEEEKKQKKKPRAQAPAPPDDVSEQTWNDWLSLRRAKKAPITQTVVDQARREAAKCRPVMTLEKFLVEWCLRGSQGLKADWINNASTERGHEKIDNSAVGRIARNTRGLDDGVDYF